MKGPVLLFNIKNRFPGFPQVFIIRYREQYQTELPSIISDKSNEEHCWKKANHVVQPDARREYAALENDLNPWNFQYFVSFIGKKKRKQEIYSGGSFRTDD